jgi:hypothetical protein
MDGAAAPGPLSCRFGHGFHEGDAKEAVVGINIA